MNALRSIGAILLGLATIMSLAYAGDSFYVRMHPEVHVPPGTILPPELFRKYAWFNIISGFFFAVAGGFVAAVVAGRREILHGVTLAAFGFALTASSLPAYLSVGIPIWYPALLGVVMPAGMVAGAAIRRQTVHRTTVSGTPAVDSQP